MSPCPSISPTALDSRAEINHSKPAYLREIGAEELVEFTLISRNCGNYILISELKKPRKLVMAVIVVVVFFSSVCSRRKKNTGSSYLVQNVFIMFNWLRQFLHVCFKITHFSFETKMIKNIESKNVLKLVIVEKMYLEHTTS